MDRSALGIRGQVRSSSIYDDLWELKPRVQLLQEQENRTEHNNYIYLKKLIGAKKKRPKSES